MNNDNVNNNTALLTDMFTILRKHKMLILKVTLVSIVLASLYLHFAKPKYEAKIIFTPVERVDGSISAVSDAGRGLSTSFLGGLSQDSQVSDFDIFLQLFSTRLLYEKVQENQPFLQFFYPSMWDGNNWHEPTGVVHVLTKPLKFLTNAPAWRQPDPHQFLGKVTEYVNIKPMGDMGSYELTVRVSDPDVALKFINTLWQKADEIIRNMALEESKAKIDYLMTVLENTTNIMHQQAVVDVLMIYDKRIMNAQAETPYVARTIQSAILPIDPVSPKRGLAMLLAIFMGLSFSSIYILIREIFKYG